MLMLCQHHQHCLLQLHDIQYVSIMYPDQWILLFYITDMLARAWWTSSALRRTVTGFINVSYLRPQRLISGYGKPPILMIISYKNLPSSVSLIPRKFSSKVLIFSIATSTVSSGYKCQKHSQPVHNNIMQSSPYFIHKLCKMQM